MIKAISARQEKFAQFIASGDSLSAAYKKSGYSGDPLKCSSAIAANPVVKLRINELRMRIAQGILFQREDLAAWLVLAILTPPNSVDGDSPLCEEVYADLIPYGGAKANRKRIRVRVKMVSKLQAAKQLAALLGWDVPVKIQAESRSGVLQDIEEWARLLVSALDRAGNCQAVGVGGGAGWPGFCNAL